MADNQLSAKAEELPDDDPFAELTRIMGQGSVLRPLAVDEGLEDLGLDLEKELLGGFGRDDAAASSRDRQDTRNEPQLNVAEAFGETEPAADDLFDDHAFSEFEKSLKADVLFRDRDAGFDRGFGQPVAAQPEPRAPRWDEVSFAPRQAASEASVEREHAFAPTPEVHANAAPARDPILDFADSVFAPREQARGEAPRVDDLFRTGDRSEPSFDAFGDGTADGWAAQETAAEHQTAEAPSRDDAADPFADFSLRDEDFLGAREPAMADELEKALRLDSAWDSNDLRGGFDAESAPAASAEEPEWTLGQASDAPAEAQASGDASWSWDFDPASLRASEPAAEQGTLREPSFDASSEEPAYGGSYASQDWAGQTAGQAWENEGPKNEDFGYGFGGGDNGPPEIETVDIPERAVAVTEALDLPEVPYREEVKPAAPLDDFEELLSGAFGGLDTPAPEQDDWDRKPEASAEEPKLDETDFDELLTTGLAAATAASMSRQGYGASDPAFASEWDEKLRYEEAPRPMPGTPPPAATSKGFAGRRTVQIAALLAGVAIIGAGGVFAYNHFTGGGSSEIALIKADDTPMKVKPENPGGASIPNQDSQVYRQVAGDQSASSGESQLVSSAEEPIELPSPNDEVEDVIAEDEGFVPEEIASMELGTGGASDSQAGAKSEERLAATAPQENASGSSEEFATLTPRRVRSFIVRPDGTMVPREVETPAQSAGNAGEADLPGVANDRVEVSTTTPSAQDEGLVPGQEIPPLDGQANVAADSQPAITMPQTAPIPAPRPVAPRQVAAAPAAQAAAPAAPTQVAAAQPVAPAQTAAASGWSVQIASQPSLEAAQQSYQSMAQRYGTILQGKGVNIVKAEVPGKGTYYRVRIPAATKNDAIALCERLKSQGGTCFVSQ